MPPITCLHGQSVFPDALSAPSPLSLFPSMLDANRNLGKDVFSMTKSTVSLTQVKLCAANQSDALTLGNSISIALQEFTYQSCLGRVALALCPAPFPTREPRDSHAYAIRLMRGLTRARSLMASDLEPSLCRRHAPYEQTPR